MEERCGHPPEGGLGLVNLYPLHDKDSDGASVTMLVS
jgi:hypothetical protein